MKKYQKLDFYPLGSIKAEGFLKEQMLRGKDGICGHLHELEPEMIADPYIKRAYVKAWEKGNQEGWGAEISGNYWTGYIEFAYTLQDPEMIRTATEWVDAVLKRQRPDGYLGTYCEEGANIYDDYNAWGTACGMRGLLAYYEATGRKDVLEAVHRCMLWFCKNWSGDNKTTYAGPFIVETMVQTYFLTGDNRLVDFSREFLEFVAENDIFGTSYRSFLEKPYTYNTSHTAGYGCQSRLPALLYTATGEEKYLKATAKALDDLYAHSVQVTGSPVSDNEYLSPVGAVAETEYCCYAFFNQTYSHMSRITGETKYGDRMEEMFYNGAQGARKKDEKAIAYMNTPNQVYATERSSRTHWDAQAYAPCYPTSCCPVNAVAVIPEFIKGMILRDGAENVYLMAYGPCSLNCGETRLTVNTAYPFRNTVTVELDCEREFTLNLRIPAFSRGYTLTVNGETVNAEEKNGFAAVNRRWKRGDRVTVSFKAVPETVELNDTDYSNNHPIAIRYGALVFALHIPERWSITAGRPMTALPDGWHWYNVYPAFEEAKLKDSHERLGMRRHRICWNVAVDESLTAEDIEVEELPENGYVWENPTVKLHTYCYKAPDLFPPYPQTTYEPYGEYQAVTDRLPLTLVPYGCTNLRITYFPKAKKKGN